MQVNANKALWEKGDFTRIAAGMRESGEAFVRGIGITPALRVLDLGCGDGTTAIPSALLGANVLGVDIASNLVAAGNKRARDMGLDNCRFQEGDGASMSELPDEAFDLVITMCFAPSPSRWPERWCVSRGRAAALSWATGYPTIPRWSLSS